MAIIPGPRSILDLIDDWGPTRACPVPACPFFVTDRWPLTNEPVPPSFDMCRSHLDELIKLMPVERQEELQRGFSLTADVRSTLQLDSPGALNTLRPNHYWFLSEPITLYGFELDNDPTACMTAAFFIRGYSKIPANELNAGQGVEWLNRPPYYAYPLSKPYDASRGNLLSEVQIWLAFAATHSEQPASRLLNHWTPGDPAGNFKTVLEEPQLLTTEQERALKDAMSKALLRTTRGHSGAPPLRPADYDARLTAQAANYLRSNPGGQVTLTRFSEAVGVPEGTLKGWIRGSSYIDWDDFRTRELPAYRAVKRQVRT